MIVYVVLYFLVFSLVLKVKKNKGIKFKKFPTLKLTKNGIEFSSFDIHRIFIKDFKVMQVENVVYLKTQSQLLTISNIDNVFYFENYLHFTSKGRVKILFDCTSIYRYFSIKIESKKFNLNSLKQMAILDLMNNAFDLNKSKIMKKYINIIENVLNIKISKEKVVVKQNKLKIPFILTYKINNKIKKVKINEITWKIF